METAILRRSALFSDLMTTFTLVEIVGALTLLYLTAKCLLFLLILVERMFETGPRKVVVGLKKEDMDDILVDMPKFDPQRLVGEQATVFKWDPSTMDYFGEMPVTSKEEVDAAVARARVAQSKWKSSSFKQVSE